MIKEYAVQTGEGAEEETEGDTESGSVFELCLPFYTTSRQVIEERCVLKPNSKKDLPGLWFNSGTTSRSNLSLVHSADYLAQQFVWNTGYVDDPLLRDHDTSSFSPLHVSGRGAGGEGFSATEEVLEIRSTILN